MDAMIGLVAYLGPETMLPMTSVIAGAIGVFLMVGKQSFRFVLGLFRIGGRSDRAKAKGRRAATANGPHVRIPAEGTSASVAAGSSGNSSSPSAE